MPTRVGPWDVGFPVKFKANGDTVHNGFYKHIQEFERVYGIMNALDSNKLDASDLAAHVNSANPHPNLTLDGSKITGVIARATIPIGNVTGNIPADRIYGLLSNATINTSNVNGLSGLINGAVGDAINNNKPIESENIDGNGYVKFKGGFMIQWGATETVSGGDESAHTQNFPTPFSSACYCVLISNVGNYVNFNIEVIQDTITKTSFDWRRNSYPYSESGTSYGMFIAIGK